MRRPLPAYGCHFAQERNILIMSYNNNEHALEGLHIGMAGFGHLGSSIAEAMLKNGLSAERLSISCAGRRSTIERARALGISVRPTGELAERSDVLILAARPQDLGSFAGLRLKKDASVVSFMAGITAEMLGGVFNAPVSRVMCSGPDPIERGMGIGTCLPAEGAGRRVLDAAGLKFYESKLEEEIDAFTVAICIPPIVSNAGVSEAEMRAAVSMMAARYPVCGRLADWIERIVSLSGGVRDPEALRNISTKGGVTEAMTTALAAGADFTEAAEAGLRRNSELAAQLKRRFGRAA